MPTEKGDGEKSRVRVRVEGIVQGVYFRATTRQEARRIGVTGWVKNSPDGSVEVVAEGETEALQRLADWCRHGPEGALVTSIEVDWESYRGEFQGFSIAH